MTMMKELSLYKIRDLALESGRSVYNSAQLANLINMERTTASVYMSRLVDKGMAKKLIRGKISFVDDDFVIASQLVEPSYISLTSALLFHNATQQIPRYVQSITTRNSITYPEVGLEYHKVNPGLMFGYERHSISGSYCFVATIEKALIDGFYLNVFSKDQVLELCDFNKFRDLIPQLEKFSGKGSKKLMRMIS